MKLSKRTIALVAALGLGLGMSAMAQGRPAMGGHPGGGPGMGGPGMGGPGMGSQHEPGQMGPGQMGQSGQMGRMSQNKQMQVRSQKKSASQLLPHNAKLSSNLQSILGPNVNLQQAASGFQNLGLFVASVHVSKNLNIPFDQLKTTMAGDHYNLGKAVHSLQPNLSKKQVKQVVKKATKEAKSDIRHSKR